MTDSPYSFDTSVSAEKRRIGKPGSKVLKAACIGTGGIYSVHMGYLQSFDNVEIVALCDINEELLKRSQERFGATGFTDFNEMLAETELDAVWICTPPTVRREPLLACADRGIPVFCEKPAEHDPHVAREIAAELKQRNARVQVGYCCRTMPIVDRLKEQMADDSIHLIQSFYGCNSSLAMQMPSWFYDKELSGGGLEDQATHNFDLLRMLVGEVKQVKGIASNPVKAKQAGYTIDEVIGLALLFEKGTMCTHAHSWVSDGWRNEILFSGEKRLYRLNIGTEVLSIEEDGETKRFEQEGTLHSFQNKVFLEMLATGDWSKNPCDYDDSLKTLELTIECNRLISEAS